MFDDYPPLLNIAEVAGILRISKRMVYQLTQDGAMSSYRPAGIGGKSMRRILVPKSALISYMGLEQDGDKKHKNPFRRGRV
jgi:excisionase family DNA binding protein